MDKKDLAHKMKREECSNCGSSKHATKEHKGFTTKESRESIKPVRESDFHRYSNPEDKFSGKDLKKEKKDWKEKAGGDYTT